METAADYFTRVKDNHREALRMLGHRVPEPLTDDGLKPPGHDEALPNPSGAENAGSSSWEAYTSCHGTRAEHQDGCGHASLDSALGGNRPGAD